MAEATATEPIEIVAGRSSYSGLELLEAKPLGGETSGPPILFVHGASHGAWCWRDWMEAAARKGHHAFAVSLRGHGGSPGSLLTGRLSTYVDDVIRTAASLPGPPVLVGHSLGGLVVQKAAERYPAAGIVLVATIPARPGVGTLFRIATSNPADFVKISLGGSLPMRPEYLFRELSPEEAEGWSAMCGKESPVAQMQVLLHRVPGPPRGDPPVLVLGAPDDALVPAGDVRDTARRLSAELIEFPGTGHDLMLDGSRDEVANALLDWIETRVDSGGPGAVPA